MSLFSRIFGQDIAKSILEPAVSKQTYPPGYLFSGPSGVGKKTMALEVARLLNCSESREETCSCDSCAKIASGTHPDVMVFSPESSVFRVSQVREVREEAKLRPYFSPQKVLILENAEKMNREAENAFLKILEEPPEYCLFIILHEGETVLPTIESRCVRVPFFPLSLSHTKEIFTKAGLGSDLDAHVSMGRVPEDDEFGSTGRQEALSVFKSLWEGKIYKSLDLMKLMGTTLPEVAVKVSYLQSFLRDAWILRSDLGEEVRNYDFQEDLLKAVEAPAEVLAMVTHRTNELSRVIYEGTLEVQLRAYFSSVLYTVRYAQKS